MNHFLYNASYFESRILNASDLEPISQNSGKFESEILECVTFRKKSLTTHQTLKWNWFVQKQTLSNVLLSEKHFLDLFSPWKRQLVQLCVFSKTTHWWKVWKEKQFPFKTFEKNQILKQRFNNASDFESRNSD